MKINCINKLNNAMYAGIFPLYQHTSETLEIRWMAEK